MLLDLVISTQKYPKIVTQEQEKKFKESIKYSGSKVNWACGRFLLPRVNA